MRSLATILDQAVQSLKPAYRTVFILSDIEEMSIEETAEALDLSISAVKSRLLASAVAASRETDSAIQEKGG